MPYVLAFAVAMIFAALTLPRTSGECLALFSLPATDKRLYADLSIYSFLFLWLALAAFSGSYIWGNVCYSLWFPPQWTTILTTG